MSYDNERDDFDEQNDPGNLRKAVDKANKAAAARDAENAELRRELNELKLGGIFADQKVPAALQRLMKAENVEADPNAVKQWLTDNGPEFGWNPQAASTEKPEGQQVTPQEAPAVQKSVLDEDDIAGQQRMQQLAADGTSPHTLSDQAEQAVQAASSVLTGSRDDFDKLMDAFRAQGIAVESSFG